MPPLDFSNDPKKHPKTLHIHQEEPFNAEPEDPGELIKHHITPTNLVYGRNHGPIPDIKEQEYALTINGLVDKELKLTLSDLKALPKAKVVTALQVTFNLGLTHPSVRAIGGRPCRNFVRQKESLGLTPPSPTASTPALESRMYSKKLGYKLENASMRYL